MKKKVKTHTQKKEEKLSPEQALPSLSPDLKLYADASHIGICIKDKTKKVLYQNEACQRACGNQMNSICEKGCMDGYTIPSDPPSSSEGVLLKKNLESNQGIMDAIIVEADDEILSVLHFKSSQVQNDLNSLKEFDLTESELKVAGYVLQKMTNKEIAEKMFIALSTVRTHLNNIYRKIPQELKQKLTRRS